MKQTRWVLFGLVALMGLFLSLSAVEPASAGSNGQQLNINVGCTWGSVSVTGKNQRGQTVTWRATNTSYFPCTRTTVSTTGYWWVGNVTIVRTVPTKACVVNVPKVQSSNWVNARCS